MNSFILNNISKSKITLLLSASIFPLTFFIYSLFPAIWNSKISFLTAMLCYWIIVITYTFLLTQKSNKIIGILFKPSNKPVWKVSYNIFAFTPVAGVFFVTFLPNVLHLTVLNFLLILLISLVNGTVEEIFWRGLYVIYFRNNRIVGIGISTILFALWHFSLGNLNGLKYHGGLVALVSGAFFMGLVWSYVAQKTGSIFFCIFSHVLVNIFAFTGLFVDNNF